MAMGGISLLLFFMFATIDKKNSMIFIHPCLMPESSYFTLMFLIIPEAIFFTASYLVQDSYVIHHMIMKSVQRHPQEPLPFFPLQRHSLCKKENLYQVQILNFL